MASIICPNCKTEVSEYDLVCLNCGHTITPEEREKLVKEHEELIAREAAEKQALHEAEMKSQHKHRLQKKLDRYSVKFLHVTLDVVTVSIIAVILLIIAAIFMLM